MLLFACWLRGRLLFLFAFVWLLACALLWFEGVFSLFAGYMFKSSSVGLVVCELVVCPVGLVACPTRNPPKKPEVYK